MTQIGDQLAQLDLDDAGTHRMPSEVFDLCVLGSCLSLRALWIESVASLHHGVTIDSAQMTGDTREERTFRMWVNSLDIEGLYINDLFADLCNGIAILQVMDRIQPGIVPWKRTHKSPRSRIHVIDNCNTVVTIGRQMDLVLVNIGGTDIADKNKKLILAIMWQLMRRFTLDMLAQLSGDGSRVTEEVMVQWANQKVQSSGKALRIRNLSDSSLSSGIYLVNLCAAVQPNTVDWDLLTDGEAQEDKLSNARYAISIARKIGACVFLTPEDIVEIKPKMLFTFIGSLWATELVGTSSAQHAGPAFSPPTNPPPPPPPPRPPVPPVASVPVVRGAAAITTAAAAVPTTTTAKPSTMTAPSASTASSARFESTDLQSESRASAKSETLPLQKEGTGFSSVNGTGETGGIYGAVSGSSAANNEDVEDAEWDD